MRKKLNLILFIMFAMLLSIQQVQALYPAAITKDYPIDYINISFDESGFVSFGGGVYFKKVVYLNFTVQVPKMLSNGSGFVADTWVSGRTCLKKDSIYPEFLVQMQFRYLKVYTGYQTVNALNDNEYFYNQSIPVPAGDDYFQYIGNNAFMCYTRINIFINTTKYMAPFASSFQFKFDNLEFSGDGGVTVVSDFTTSLFIIVPTLAVSLTMPFALFIMFNKKPKAFGIGCILSGLVSIFGGLDTFAIAIGFIVMGGIILLYNYKKGAE